ncbi:MAG: response regulator [Vulcanimicrobiota bacterium]
MSQPARILLLEDDAQLRTVLQTVLEAEGYIVMPAPLAEEALALAQQSPPDLVVADIRMEGMDGLDALAAIKEENPRMRSLVVTGYSTEADSIRAIRLGVGDYLKKPFDLDEFLRVISKLLQAQQQESERREESYSLRQTLLWVLRSLIGNCLNRAPGLARLEEISDRLSLKVGFSAQQREDVLLLSLYGAAREVGGGKGGGPPLAGLPPELDRAYQAMSEFWDGSGPRARQGQDIPLISRVASLVLASCLVDLPDELVARQLQLDYPGRFDPGLLDLLGRGAEEPPDDRPEAAQLRGMLVLARALEESQQLALAEQTYRQLAQQSSDGRERVAALQGSARLAQEAAAALPLWKEAQLAAEQVSPLLAGECALEGARRLQQLGENPVSWAERALACYQSAQDACGQALASLYLAFLHNAAAPEAACERLLAPDGAEVLTRCIRWLLPCLLWRPSWLQSQPAVRLLGRFLRDHEGVFLGWWNSGRLDQAGRRRLALALAQSPQGMPAAFRRALASDTDAEVRQLGARTDSDANEVRCCLRLHSMGNFEVFADTEKVADNAWKTQKVKFLLALLVSRGGRAVAEELIMEEFWPGDLEKGKQNLYWATSVLRRCLKGLGRDPISRVHTSLQINPEIERWHDLDLLEESLRACREQLVHQSAPSLAGLRRILELYRGPYLQGCYLDWAEATRTRMARLTAETLEDALNKLVALENWAVVPEVAQGLLTVDSCHSTGHAALMQAALAANRPDEAIRRFDLCKRVFQRELQIEPGLALFELYQKARLSR